MQHRLNRSFFKPVFLFALLLATFGVRGQTVTGSVATRIFQNSSATLNSTLTFQVNVSSGWVDGSSKLTTLVLTNPAGTTTYYTHADPSLRSGTISGLAAGNYKFTGNVSTKNSGGSFVSVPITGDVWIGYKVAWEQILDMSQGTDQYSVKRDFVTPGNTRGYAVSFNQAAANTAAWIDLKTFLNPVSTGSRIYVVLEPLANPETFTPTDNITHLELYYIDASKVGVILRSRNASNVYANSSISGVKPTDQLRFSRTAAGVATIVLNQTTVLKTLDKTLKDVLKVQVLVTSTEDQLTDIVSSFGYPSATFPMSATYSAETNTGRLTTQLVPLTTAVAPYHYFSSDKPIPGLKELYKNQRDSIFGGTLDSTDFFTGSTSNKSMTFGDQGLGTTYVSAFDSRGVRIFSNTYALRPGFASNSNSGIVCAGDEYLSTGPKSYATERLYLSDANDGSVSFQLYDLGTNEQAFGFVETAKSINPTSGSALYANIKYGFFVKNGVVKIVQNGSVSGSYTAKLNTFFTIKKEEGQVKFIYDGVEVLAITALSGFMAQPGIIVSDWGIRVRAIPGNLDVSPFDLKYTISNNTDCVNLSNVSLAVTYPSTVPGTSSTTPLAITSKSIQLYTSEGTAVGIVNQASFTGLPVGVYYLQGTYTVNAVSYPYLRYIYAGYKNIWDNYQYLESSVYNNVNPGGGRAVGSTSLNGGHPGQAIGTGKLPAVTAGWICFKPVSTITPVTDASTNVFMLSPSPQLGSLGGLLSTTIPMFVFPTGGGILTVYLPGNGPAGYVPRHFSYSPNFPILVERTSAGVLRISQNGVEVTPTLPGTYNTRWKSSALIKRTGSGFEQVLSSFPCPADANDIYAQLKYELDGFYHTMTGGQIRFVYNQEYTDAPLTFNIYTGLDKLAVTQAYFNPVLTTHGTNYLTINVSDNAHCIGKGFFYLEVINSKNEKMYLRFYNDYSNCIIPQGPLNPADPGSGN